MSARSDRGGGTDARRPRSKAELDAFNPALWPVAQRLAEKRLVVTTAEVTTAEPVVDVVHEALFRRWDRLRGHLEETGGWDIHDLIEAVQLQGQRPMSLETWEWECLVRGPHAKGNPALLVEARRQLLNQLTEGRADDDPAGLQR